MREPAADTDGLLTLARDAHGAADDGDVGRLSDDLSALADALTGHLLRELPLLTRLSPVEARLLRRRRARVWAATGALLRASATGCAGPRGHCAARVEELVALLRLQVRDEWLALGGLSPEPTRQSLWSSGYRVVMTMDAHDESESPREQPAPPADEPVDIVSEWGYESFPASDPPQSWCYGRSGP